MCVCVCVCVCVCIYIYIYMCSYLIRHTYSIYRRNPNHLYTHTHTHIYICVCVCVYMCLYLIRLDPTRLPKIMIHWKPEGRKKRGCPRRTWKDGIFTAMNERDLRMGEWEDRRQWNMAAGRRGQMF